MTANDSAERPGNEQGGQRDDNRDVTRAADHIAGELRQRGVLVHDQDGPEQLTMMLDALEQFEGAVRAQAGDSYTNTPQSSNPDRPEFVVPRRNDDEGPSAYAARVLQAAERLR